MQPDLARGEGRGTPDPDQVAAEEPSGGATGRTSQAGGGGLFSSLAGAFSSNRLALVGVAVLVAIVLFCFVGPLVYRTNQTVADLALANLPPSGAHPLGTDGTGFDILGRLMLGGRSSLELGLGVAALATTVGVVWGAVAGLAGGAVDSVMMRLVDIFLAIPPLFVFVYLATVFTPTIGLLILVVSLVSWLSPARLIRGETLSLRSREYVQATRAAGGRFARIVLRHIVPNTFSAMVVNATFQVADAILILATLSFLGFGPPAPAATWGGMLSNGVNFLYDGYWWQVYPAGIAIVVTVVSFNFVGDALRDALDPRFQRR
jgi:peptide/nickel transport system permease protein